MSSKTLSLENTEYAQFFIVTGSSSKYQFFKIILIFYHFEQLVCICNALCELEMKL